MITDRTMIAEEYSDTELVSRSLAGDRDAFSHIVSRYQTLICSLAYSRIGNLGQSEDVAQETFITAWKRLGHLREPAKLRPWLCGIVRNRIQKSLYREGLEPAHHAESLELVHDSPAGEILPSEHVVSREEEAILWRSLEKVPEIYREPLILFYRGHQSIEAVAAELDLSEDAVRQRLSRGRKLLQEEVHAFVENTLRRTAPSRAFSSAVLAALPVGPVTAAGLGVSGKTAIGTKFGSLATWIAPVLGIFAGIMAHWLIVRAAPTPRERRLKKIAFIALWTFVLTWCIPGTIGMRALARYLQWNDATYFRAMAAFWWFYAVVITTLGVVMFRRTAAMRRESETASAPPRPARNLLQTGAGIAVVAGIHLGYFSWLIGLALAARDQISAASIVGLMTILAIWYIVRLRNKTGTDAVRVIAGHQALIWAIIVVILNWRLGTWMSSLNGIELPAMRLLLPVWIIPLLSLTLVAWVFFLIIATRDRAAKGHTSGSCLKR